MLTPASLWVLLVRNSVFPALFISSRLSLSLGFYGSPQRSFFYGSRRKIDHIWRHRRSSDGKKPFLVCVCGPHYSVRKNLQNTLISVWRMSCLGPVAYLALVLEVGHSSRGGWLLGGVSVGGGHGSLDVFIARLHSENLSIDSADETLGV